MASVNSFMATKQPDSNVQVNWSSVAALAVCVVGWFAILFPIFRGMAR